MSSLGGSCRCGKRSRSRRTVSIVSSTDSVVCESQTTLSGSRTDDLVGVLRAVDELDVRRRLARGALDLLVAGVADEQDVEVVRWRSGRPPCAPWSPAGRSRRWSAAGARSAAACTAGATPCAEKTTSPPSGTSSVSSTKIAPRRSSVCDDVLVVHDLLAHVDRRPVQLQGLLDGDDGPVDPGAVAAGRGEQHPPAAAAGAAPRRGRSVAGTAPGAAVLWSAVGSRCHRRWRAGPPAVGAGRADVHRRRCVTGPVLRSDGRRVPPRRVASVSTPRADLPPTAGQTSAEQPWPVRLLTAKIAEYLAKAPAVWVEGQVVQLTRRPGQATCFLTLRDTDVDLSFSVTVARPDPRRAARGARRRRARRRPRPARVLPARGSLSAWRRTTCARSGSASCWPGWST